MSDDTQLDGLARVISERASYREYMDCTVVALAIVSDLPYSIVHDMLARAGRKDCHKFALTSYMLDLDTMGQYVIERIQMPQSYLTLAKLRKDFPKGRFLVRIRAHCFVMIDGKIIDRVPNGGNCLIRAIWHFTRECTQ
jgi:hypothetical protein